MIAGKRRERERMYKSGYIEIKIQSLQGVCVCVELW